MNLNGKIILITVISLGISIWAIGYIPRYPIWVDDFSCLDNDVLSRMIINGRYDRPDPRLARGTGYSMLDSVKIRRLSDSVFVGRDKEVIINTFNDYGCGCQILWDEAGDEHLVCKFRRQWRIKNVGMHHESEDVAFWVRPIVVVIYDFHLEKTGLVESVRDIKMIEATQHVNYNGKSSIIN